MRFFATSLNMVTYMVKIVFMSLNQAVNGNNQKHEQPLKVINYFLSDKLNLTYKLNNKINRG